MNDKERTWLDNASARGGSFVSTFAKACFCADDKNFEILRPILHQMMQKYSGYCREEVGA